MFTKQHHEAIAKSIKPVYQKALNDSVSISRLNGIWDVVEGISKTFSKDNPNFNDITFADAITK